MGDGELPLNEPIPRATRARFADQAHLSICTLGPTLELNGLRGKTGYLMISVKNPKFSNALIEAYCAFSAEFLARSYLTVVDTPYFANVAANQHDMETAAAEIEKLKHISRETVTRIGRIVAKYPAAPIKVLLWRDLERETPTWLVEEIRAAFRNKGCFYRDIIDRTRAVMPANIPESRLEAFSQFMVVELPVLFYIYFLRDPGLADFYPDENPDLIWKIERGFYGAELPQLTALATRGPRVVYVDFRLGGDIAGRRSDEER